MFPAPNFDAVRSAVACLSILAGLVVLARAAYFIARGRVADIPVGPILVAVAASSYSTYVLVAG
jgi:hypothetical protein